MTDLQVRYWQAQEQARANKAQEALKSRSVDLQEREVKMDEAKLDYEIQKLIADIERIQADTELTKDQKQSQIVHRWNESAQAIKNTLGAVMEGYSFMSLFA